MRKLLIAIALSASCVGTLTLSTPAMASQAASSLPQSLRSLQQLETLSYHAATSFYLYSVLNRHPEHLKKAQTSLASADAIVKEVGNAAINARWTAFRQSIASARFTSENVAESSSLNTIDSSLTALAQAIRSARTEQRASANVNSDKMADLVYDQHVLMQVMTAAYLRNAADSFGGAIVQSDAPLVEIDKLAHRFSAQLDTLTKHYSRNAQVAPLLRDVNTKWLFIQKSFINFNENNVPFIVGRYNEQITQRLLDAYEKLI